MPLTPILTTPLQDNDDIDLPKGAPFTPSPQAVHELDGRAVTSANRSAVVSRLISDHLVTVDSDEVIVSSRTVSLPELEEAHANADRGHDSDGSASTAGHETPVSSPLATPSKHVPPIPIQHKMLYQSVAAFASPMREEDCMPQLHVGDEREVLFHTDSLGIKISRHTDGYVRVLSVTPYRAMDGAEKVREGEICAGDVVREVSDVNLRMPIDAAVWKLTVGLIKMAPRPLKFVVAKELTDGEDEEPCMQVGNMSPNSPAGAPRSPMQQPWQQPMDSPQSCPVDHDDARFGPTREIHFFESCLGVKLHRNPDGYVQILSVAPYKSFPNSPLARTGDAKAGDIVLEVGGVWNLRDPIDGTAWAALVRFIRETRRPLCMVVADSGCMEAISKEEEEAVVEHADESNSDGNEEVREEGKEEQDLDEQHSRSLDEEIQKYI